MEPSSLKRLASTDGPVSPPASKRKLSAPVTATATAAATPKAISNFFKPTSQKEPERIKFSIRHDTLLTAHYTPSQTQQPSRPKPVKIAAFDFDDTLITTKSGLKFARGADDWKWWHASVPARLKQLHAEGYAVVVCSNQGAVSLKPDSKIVGGMRSLNTLKAKAGAVFNALDLEGGMALYAATGQDLFRKPRVGMWEEVVKNLKLSGKDGEAEVDLGGSVFVGDAGGRAGVGGKKKDHSCSDRDFAANVGIRFQTPEEFFLGEEARPFVRAFDPKTYFTSEVEAETDTSPVVFAKKNGLDLVLFCGSPGAGKSTFYWRHMEPLGYERVNQDILKTRDKCLKVATQFLQEKKSVVVDNTNADIETRQAWIALARQLDVPVRLVHFTASSKLCEHNDTVRALNGDLMNPETRTMLPRMAFTSFASRYREPKLAEGFQDITKVDFEFEGSEEQRLQWAKYWIS